MEKRYAQNPEVVEYYFKVRRKKQHRFVWEFLQKKSGNFYVNVADNSRAVETDFLTPLREDDASNDHLNLAMGRIGSGEFRKNRKYANAKFGNPNISQKEYYGDELGCKIFTFLHLWKDYKVCLFNQHYDSQLASLGGQIIVERQRLEKEGKPYTKADVFIEIGSIYRSLPYSVPSMNKFFKAWKKAAKNNPSLFKAGRPKKKCAQKQLDNPPDFSSLFPIVA